MNMSTSDYIDILKESFDSLFSKHGFHIKDHVDAENFGNKYTTLESDSLVLAIAKDRGIVYLDVRANDGREVPRNRYREFFYDLSIVLRALRAPEVKELDLLTSGTDEEQLGALARALETHYSAIADMFSPDKIEATKLELKRLENERAKELFG
jgi:hypothetical protein